MTLALFLIFLQTQTFSPAREAGLGAQMARDIQTRTTPVEDATLRGRIEKIGARLAKHIAGPFPWTFALVKDFRDGPAFEPLSLPGGYIFIQEGLIRNAQSDDEIAGMLAQAMSRKPLRTTGSPGTIPLIFVGGWSEGNALPLALLPEQKKIETEADQAAVRVMSDAGYDPNALYQYIARMQPGNTGRLAAIKAAINALN